MLAVLGVVVTVLLSGALPAAAHDTLVSSDPAAGAVVADLPSTVTLTFDQQVQQEFLTVVLTPDGGPAVPLTATANGSTVTATVTDSARQAVTAGQDRAFRLGYRLVSADDHPVTGSIDFTVGTAARPFGQSTAGGTTPGASAVAADQDATTTGTTWWPWALAAAVIALALVLVARWRHRPRPSPEAGEHP